MPRPRPFESTAEGYPNDYLREHGYEERGPDIDEDLPEEEWQAAQAARRRRAGTSTLLYVNAYAVSRHFGGREEGGWWYNAGEPLASIPIRAMLKLNVDGDVAIFPVSWNSIKQEVRRLERTFMHVREGDIYSVLGGTELEVQVETHQAAYWPAQRPHYE